MTIKTHFTNNTVFKRSYNDKLAPSNGAERIANFAILIANIFLGTNITPLNTTESLGSMKLAMRNLTDSKSIFGSSWRRSNGNCRETICI